jgi:hypothetical protein
MPKLSEHRTDPEMEFRYRHGYVHGVHEILTAVEPYLTEEQLWKFRQWTTGPLFAWRHSKGEFFAPPAPGLESA